MKLIYNDITVAVPAEENTAKRGWSMFLKQNKIWEEIERVAYVLGFMIILCGLIWGIKDILKNPIGTSWACQTVMETAHRDKGTYDVCFCGTSTTIANNCNQYLYENYGIAGISLGELKQPLYLTKYTLAELLQTQNPQIILGDSKFFYPVEGEKKR